MRCYFYLCLLCMCCIGLPVAAQNPASLPSDKTLSAPEQNFETFWQTFEDNYAFFKERNINWRETYKKYRPQVNASTTDDKLFEILSDMVRPFNDDHINIIIPSVKQFKARKPSRFLSQFGTDTLRKQFWAMVDETLHKNNFSALQCVGPSFHGRQLFYYATSPQAGYLRFNRSFSNPDEDNIKDAQITGLMLDTIFAKFKNLRGLIIDVRDNIGGNDEFSFEVAGKLTNTKTIGLYKNTRVPKGGYQQMGKTQTYYITPKGSNRFLKPVTVLTNDQTKSAADVFALITRQLPNAKIIGENSRGIYSDMYGFELPNKWQVSLSNQKYYDAQNICYETIGTPVNIKVENTVKDLTTMTDPLITTSLEQLKGMKAGKPATRKSKK